MGARSRMELLLDSEGSLKNFQELKLNNFYWQISHKLNNLFFSWYVAFHILVELYG